MKHKYSKSYEKHENYIVVEFGNVSYAVVNSQYRFYCRTLLSGSNNRIIIPELYDELKLVYKLFLIKTVGGGMSFFLVDNEYKCRWITVNSDNTYTTTIVTNNTFPRTFKYPPKVYELIINTLDRDVYEKIILQLEKKIERDKNQVYYYKFNEKLMEDPKSIDLEAFFIIYEIKYSFESLCDVLKDNLTYKSGKFRFI